MGTEKNPAKKKTKQKNFKKIYSKFSQK